MCLPAKPDHSEGDVAPEAREHAAGEDGSDPKSVIRRMIDEVMNAGRLDVIDEVYSPPMARAARRWIKPFRESFPDVQMDIVDLIAEGEKVVGRFHCSATNLGPWHGRPPTGRRFERVDEVYIFRVRDGAIVEAWGMEDTRSRERQLGLSPSSSWGRVT
jgi:predicted ester cyclase